MLRTIGEIVMSGNTIMKGALTPLVAGAFGTPFSEPPLVFFGGVVTMVGNLKQHGHSDDRAKTCNLSISCCNLQNPCLWVL